MFSSAVLELAAGLAFVFLLVSLICSAVGDKISDLFKWRAVELENGIRDFILGTTDPKGMEIADKTLKDLYDHPLVKSLALKETGAQAALQKILPSSLARGDKPINIPAQTFVLALFDTVVPSAAGKTKVGDWRLEIENKISKDSPLYKPLLALVTGAD